MMESDNVKILSDNLFPVVGIGASAGGLDAFKRLIKAISPESGMAYILVQHLAAAQESILTELLQKITTLPVQKITDHIRVEPNHIYVIPSNKLLTASDGILQLSPRLPKGEKNLPIDIFFDSLAAVHRDHAIGVVLSGTASDGTIGLKAIKDSGGITFVQKQDSAAYDGMPQSAIDAGVADYILLPEEIPAQLLLLQSAGKMPTGIDQLDHTRIDESSFAQILALLRASKGVDFRGYKETTIHPRIRRRITLSMISSLEEYVVYLRNNKTEQQALYLDLLIPLTQFFRDPAMFDGLHKTIFPAIIKAGVGLNPVRMWIPGCSTGEEAYSIVIAFHEFLLNTSFDIRLQVFATDLSETAIAKARTGVYQGDEISGLSPHQLELFFTKNQGQFLVNKPIRDTCTFARHNYVNDPPFARMDLISCRNSLLYLEPFLQKKALTAFHYALKEGGFLVLGISETAAQASELYDTYDEKYKFYRRKAVKSAFLHSLGNRTGLLNTGSADRVFVRDANLDDFQRSAEQLLLTYYIPPGVIVNSNLDIVQFRGATGNWLEAPPGKPNSNLLKMAREALVYELRIAMDKVKTGEDHVIITDIPFGTKGSEKRVTIEVFRLPNTMEVYYLVLFSNLPAEMEKAQPALLSAADSDFKMHLTRIQRLEDELGTAREDIGRTTEDQEAANEELQSANEELLASSEELQSLIKELETSKEQIEKSNEELQLLNEELYDRNNQLDLGRKYAESIVSTIREPLVVLGNDFKIRSANNAFYEHFLITEQDVVGVALFELSNKQWDIATLKKMLSGVLLDHVNRFDFEFSADFLEMGHRFLLINATRIVLDYSEKPSILMVIEDVTEKRNAESIAKSYAVELEKKVLERTLSLQQANTNLQLANDSLQEFAYIASHDLQEPLRKIRTFASVLQEKYRNEVSIPVKLLLGKISTASGRMSALIKELLKFSSVLHNNPSVEQTDLNDILSRVLDDFELLIAEKNIVIQCDPLPVIDAVPSQMNQLFYNLISNSIKFAKLSDGCVIQITSRILTVEENANHVDISPDYSYCEISVKDNGIGFKQDFAEKIFLVFRRLHSKEKYSGTGMGLALCKKIVNNHHGKIFAVSSENEGALFRVLLPLTSEGLH